MLFPEWMLFPENPSPIPPPPVSRLVRLPLPIWTALAKTKIKTVMLSMIPTVRGPKPFPCFWAA